jgi:hypothetical protein
MAESAGSAFEQIMHRDEQGEYWLARELGQLLGYDKWQNFLGVIHDAMEVCRVQGGSTEGIFTVIGKKPAGRGRPSAEYDYRLTRHACYLGSVDICSGPFTATKRAHRQSGGSPDTSGPACQSAKRCGESA